jgi:hypothetical protein
MMRISPTARAWPILATLLILSLPQVRAERLDDPVKVDAETEKVIAGALRYLAGNQAPSGAWFGIDNREKQYPIAMTAYTLMAFLAAGHLPGEGEYGSHVAKGAKYLVDSVDEEGLIGDKGSGQYMYFHGIATIALAELYGQTSDDSLRQKLDRLVKVIISSQNDEGGWRYKPYVADADISVTVLQVVALRAAKNGGLRVPQQTIDDAVGYVRSCYVKSDGGFSYQPGKDSGFARTAAAIYSLQVCGEYDDPKVKTGSDYLFERFGKNERYFTYGNFYAAPAQYMIGGKVWADWYAKIKEHLLAEAQPLKEGQFFWQSGHNGAPGPHWTTAVNAMILAMPNHYIPLYQR